MSAAPPSHLLWIDPGKMTGFAYLYPGSVFGAYELAWDEACRELELFCVSEKNRLSVGYERFTILPSTHKLSPQPEAYEFPGVIRFLVHKYGCRLLPPALPAERTMATAAELETLGWWPPGLDDAQSAAQHLLAFLKREHCVPPELETKLARARSGTV
jgi:hypothetical protein